MIRFDKLDVLSRTPLFGQVSPASLKSISGICFEKRLKKKEMLFYEGDPGSTIFILVVGCIKLYKTAPDGSENVIKLVQSGEMFGEAVLFESAKYPVSSISLKEGMAYSLPKKSFLGLLDASEFRNDFFAVMMRKVRYLTNQIGYLRSYDVEERLFLFLEEQYGRSSKIIPQVSKKEIASAIGTKPETLSRLFVRLKGEGKLHWEGREIRVSPDAWVDT